MGRLRISVLAGAVVLAATTLAGAAGGAAGPPSHVGGVVPPIGVRRRSAGNLTYHGGPVMHTNKTYAIYWVPAGYSMTANYKATINQYFTDVAAASGATSNVYSVETQYYDTAPNPSPGNVQYSSTFGGSVTDTGAFPTSNDCPVYNGLSICLTDAQIIAKTNAVAAAQGWVEERDEPVLRLHAAGRRQLLRPARAAGLRVHAVLRIPRLASEPHLREPAVCGRARV